MGRLRDAVAVLFGKKNLSGLGDFVQRIAPGLNRGKSARSFPEIMDNFTSYIYACANRNASAAAKCPLRLYVVKPSRSSKMSAQTRALTAEADKTLRGRAHLQRWLRKAEPGEVEEVVVHPMMALLDEVNDIEDRFTLLELTHICNEMVGNAYWYLDTNSIGIPTQLIPILPQFMFALTTGKGVNEQITGYKYKCGTVQILYSIEDIVHFRYPNPNSRIYGLGKFPPASEAFDILDGYNDYERGLLQNQARPDIVLSTDGTVDKDARNRMVASWKKTFGGPSNANGVFVAEGGLQAKPLSYPPRDMAPFQSRKLSREEIAAVFGVPMSKLTTDAVNLANAEAGNYSHLSDTVEPMLLRNEQTLNARLVPLYGDNLFVAYDNCVPENLEFKLKERESNLKTGYSSINEQRQIDGMEASEWGDVPILPTSMAPIGSVPVEQFAPPVVEASVVEHGGKDICGHDHTEKTVEKARRGDIEYEWRLPWQKRMDRRLKEYFSEQETAMIRLLRKAKTIGDVQDVVTFGLNTWNEKLARDVGPVYKGLAFASGTRELARLPVVGVTFDVESPAMTRHFEEWEPKFANNINEGTARRLKDALRAGVGEGENMRELSQRIHKIFSIRKLSDAVRIARTETARAQMFAAEQGMIQSGVVLAKEWATAGDPCIWCDEMDGKTIALGTEYFKLGGQLDVLTEDASGGTVIRTMEFDYTSIGAPPLHPLCRCTIIEVMK